MGSSSVLEVFTTMHYINPHLLYLLWASFYFQGRYGQTIILG